MAGWREEYLSSLKEAELRIPVNMELVQTCSWSPRKAHWRDADPRRRLANGRPYIRTGS